VTDAVGHGPEASFNDGKKLHELEVREKVGWKEALGFTDFIPKMSETNSMYPRFPTQVK
jgi:hypothetical protein